MTLPVLSDTRDPRLRDRVRMGAWGAAWLFVSALRKPSLPGVMIALFLWLMVPLVLTVEVTIVLQVPFSWWLVPLVLIAWALLIVVVITAAYAPRPHRRSYMSTDGSTIFRLRRKRRRRNAAPSGPTFIKDNFCRSMRADKGSALAVIASLYDQLALAVDIVDADVEITAAHPSLAHRYRSVDALLEERGKAFPRGVKLYRPRKSERDRDASGGP